MKTKPSHTPRVYLTDADYVRHINDLKQTNEVLLAALKVIAELDLSAAHDMQRVKYTDDERVSYCEAAAIARQVIAAEGGK